jgi:hypothetical protein
MKKLTIETNPEFASEIVLSIPYVYYLHENDMLEKVVTCKGMSPFYYFCDNVEEVFEYRTLDNAIGLKDIPNKWLHNSEAGGRRHGVIDYSEWICPPYRDHFSNNLFDHLKPYVIVNNIYNPPWLENGAFDIQSLYDIFTYLTDVGYTVIYKRPTNKEFALDGNEVAVENLSSKLCANVEGIGVITDYELCDYYEKVININDLQGDMDYSTLNLKLFAETDGFVTVNGAGSQFCACFGKPIAMHVLRSKELRPGYLEYDDCYFKMLSGAQLNPIYDDYNNWNGNPSNRKYKELIDIVKNTFKGR